MRKDKDYLGIIMDGRRLRETLLSSLQLDIYDLFDPKSKKATSKSIEAAFIT